MKKYKADIYGHQLIFEKTKNGYKADLGDGEWIGVPKDFAEENFEKVEDKVEVIITRLVDNLCVEQCEGCDWEIKDAMYRLKRFIEDNKEAIYTGEIVLEDDLEMGSIGDGGCPCGEYAGEGYTIDSHCWKTRNCCPYSGVHITYEEGRKEQAMAHGEKIVEYIKEFWSSCQLVVEGIKDE